MSEIDVVPSMYDSSIFNKEITVYLSPEDYSQLVKEMEPFQKLAEKYTSNLQKQKEENPKARDNQIESVSENIDSLKDKPSKSIFGKDNKSSIFGGQNIRGCKGPEPSKTISIFASKKSDTEISCNKGISKSIFINKTQNNDAPVVKNEKEEEKHELKEPQQDIEVESQAIDIPSIVSKFLASSKPAPKFKDISESKLFGAKMKKPAEASTGSSEFEFSPDLGNRQLLKDYISVLNVNIFLLMTRAFDEDLQEIVVDSEENTEKF